MFVASFRVLLFVFVCACWFSSVRSVFYVFFVCLYVFCLELFAPYRFVLFVWCFLCCLFLFAFVCLVDVCFCRLLLVCGCFDGVGLFLLVFGCVCTVS